MLATLITYFFPKRIVWATGYPRGILIRAIRIHGKPYLTIAVTNVAINGKSNQALLYHIPAHKVLGIQRSITPFQRWLYSRVLHKPLPHYPINPLKK